MIKLLDTLKSKTLGGNDGHPLGVTKEAEAIFAELRGMDSSKALGEITHWFESVGAGGFKPDRLFATIKRLDDVAQPHRAKASRDYGALSRQSRLQENALWAVSHDFWAGAARSYDAIIQAIDLREKGYEGLKAIHGLLAVRALRASAMCLKWLYVRYGPIPPTIWSQLSRAYRFAEERGLGQTRVTVYDGLAGESSPEEEFVRAQLLAASAPDALAPAELELAERLIAHLATRFKLTAAPQPDSTYWLNLSEPRQPLRLAAPPAQVTPGLRFFATASGFTGVEEMLKRLDTTQEFPRGVDLGGTPDARVLREVLRHLITNWAPKPPVRRSERRRIQARVNVTGGLEKVMQLLRGGGVDVNLDFSPPETETWVVENMSAGGFGATVPQIKAEWLKIGSLLAVQPELSPSATSQSPARWDVAIVRRLAREPAGGAAAIGVQIISRRSVATNFQGGVLEAGIFMPDAVEAGAVLVALAPGAYAPGEQLALTVGGRRHLLFPVGVAERGEDYELIKFRDMVQDAQ